MKLSFLEKLINRPAKKPGFSPFYDEAELMVAQAIHTLQKRFNRVLFSSLMNGLQGSLETYDIQFALAALERKELIAHEGNAVLLTQNGEAALARINAAQVAAGESQGQNQGMSP